MRKNDATGKAYLQREIANFAREFFGEDWYLEAQRKNTSRTIYTIYEYPEHGGRIPVEGAEDILFEDLITWWDGFKAACLRFRQ